MTSEALEKIDRARVVVAELNYGKREWKGLHEPASEDATDVVIMEALRCAALEISRLTRELEAARERERALREALVEVAIPLEAFWMAMHDSDLLSAEVREAVRKALGIVRRTVGATTVREGGE